ncbi:MAG TPA: hypothetical protein DCL35_04740 [Candidatus Omnitrophica bacterium]|nr:hypothetical protein [Candidatus Omnitrophota bacterium]
MKGGISPDVIEKASSLLFFIKIRTFRAISNKKSKQFIIKENDMLKRSSLIAVVLIALFAVAGLAMAQEEAVTETGAMPAVEEAVTGVVNVGNKVCPVTGLKIKNLGEYTVEHEGEVYNLCCPECKEQFLADPAKYIAIVDKELAGLEMEEGAMMGEEAAGEHSEHPRK